MHLMFATSSLRAANIFAVFRDIPLTCCQLIRCHLCLGWPTSLVVLNELSGLCFDVL
jgi:hypothetical protein